MKAKSPFDNLTPEEKNHVINLCDKLTYREVLERIAQPRPEGLALETSSSALCRFYSQWHPLSYQLQVDSQLADVMDEGYLESGDKFFRGILALAQQLVFAELQECDSLQDAAPSVNLLLRLRRDYHQQLKLRSGNKSPRPEPKPEPELVIPSVAPCDEPSASVPPPPAPAKTPSALCPPSTGASAPRKSVPMSREAFNSDPDITVAIEEFVKKFLQIPPNSVFSTDSTTNPTSDFPPASGSTPNPNPPGC